MRKDQIKTQLFLKTDSLKWMWLCYEKNELSVSENQIKGVVVKDNKFKFHKNDQVLYA